MQDWEYVEGTGDLDVRVRAQLRFATAPTAVGLVYDLFEPGADAVVYMKAVRGAGAQPGAMVAPSTGDVVEAALTRDRPRRAFFGAVAAAAGDDDATSRAAPFVVLAVFVAAVAVRVRGVVRAARAKGHRPVA